jgi:hypothetical protein
MALDHLAKLNTEQRRPVEHGVGAEADGLAAPYSSSPGFLSVRREDVAVSSIQDSVHTALTVFCLSLADAGA